MDVPVNRRILVLVSVLTVMCAAQMAAAKPLARILKESGLTQSDFDQILAAEQALIAYGHPPRTQGWQNSETGAKGASEPVSSRGACLYIRHLVTLTAASPRREFRTALCRSSDGECRRQAV